MAAPTLHTVDLMHLGRPGTIGAHLLGDVIVDPGAERTVGRVIEALGDVAPRALLLTHVHFDHAGSAGALVQRYPHLEVWVHELGARHLVDPTRLVASARRVYGEYFDELWGQVMPVPAANLRVLRGGESDGDWQVAYTPGHAKHHVSYLHRPTRTAFTGDVTGIRMDAGPAFPPTPPPDIDPPLWHQSLQQIADWRPRRLAYSHFGQSTDVAQHLAGMHAALDAFTDAAHGSDAAGMARWIRGWLEHRAPAAQIDRYYWASPFEGMWGGLNRWWQQ
ncbi:MAG: MBL fold metallo-hydrolase, partial [Solirubrobacteraceae bacterium]|nr:MBL fold metallo-hydrolase [Solirubrobacteraceae bacterium]